MAYDTPLTSYENHVKALSILPIKYHSEATNLTTLELWLEKQLQIIFNRLANILAAEIKNKQK